MNRLDPRRMLSDACDRFPLDFAEKALHALVEFDRYQVSTGIVDAAHWLKRQAFDAGLRDVSLSLFDPGTQIGDVLVPTAWTPRRATLKVEDRVIIRYPDEPFSLATNSLATNGALRAQLVDGSQAPPRAWRGALVLLPREGPPLHWALAQAASSEAAGVVTDAAPTTTETQVGRLELAPETSLFAFSVVPSRMATLLGTVGRKVVVDIAVDQRGALPLVVGSLPGESEDELLLTAHLCHPGPGANDNASGVATLLAVARLLAASPRRRRRTIRFVWGPEMIGSALDRAMHRNRRIGCINLDMVGENQALCGGVLTVERPPVGVPAHLSAIAEFLLDALPTERRSYSGAVSTDPWTWRSTPFVGASDHVLDATASPGVPTIQFGHWPDRFNHSSADTLDKVDGDAMRRVGSVVASLADLAADAHADNQPDLEPIVVAWALRRLAAAHATGRRAVLDAAAEVGIRAVDGIRSLLGAAAPGDDTAKRALVDAAAVLGAAITSAPPKECAAFHRLRQAPFDLRALIGEATADDRAWLLDTMASDKGMTYGLMTSVFTAANSQTSWDDVIARAMGASELVVDWSLAERAAQVLCGAGWIGHVGN